jgi:hypothetical protein|tara:strand:- start:913 stop:1644 length:732 start_codon:yes stop_codon:yes gene_type:complete
MKIDLRKIPVVYMNLIQDVEKNKNMQSLLKECGFETIHRVEGSYRPDRHCAGTAGAQFTALTKLANPPFIIFEDDCHLHNFEPEIEVPDNADAVYLGTSQWGRYFNFSGPFVHYEKIDEKIVRVYNMLGAHAILYLTSDYVKLCERIAYKGIYVDRYDEESQPLFDVGVTEIQKLFNVYSVNDPFFKQDGYNEAVTSCKINDVGIEISNAKEFFDDVKIDFRKLQGIPDLNNSPSTYHPIRII